MRDMNNVRHFYSVTQSMETGKLTVNEWDVKKETDKTVSYSYKGSHLYTKNKSYFNQVHLDSKSDYTGKNQNAYVFVGICDSKEEALEKAIPLFREWNEKLLNGVNMEDDEITEDEIEK